MKGTGRGRGRGKGNSGRDGAGGGCGNFRERECFAITSQPPIQQIRVAEVSLETGYTSNPSQGRLQAEQLSSDPLQRTSPGTQSSRNLEESFRPSLEVEIGAISRTNRKRGRGKYKSKTVDIKTKYGGKLKLDHEEQYLISRWKLAEYCFKTWRSNVV
ncbi:hypothetical protein KY285_024152 [Solanum tuberosum]|nr:hypothetical protein KY285_024152 [Solanum tuberosum]